LKADIAERCRLLNEKKAALDTKIDTSAHCQRLQLLEKELEDLKAKVWATEHPGREEPHCSLQIRCRGPDCPAEDRTHRAKRFKSAVSVR
jgi:hypothetical protein